MWVKPHRKHLGKIMKQINLFGVNFESINTAIFLAGLDLQVYLIGQTDAINALLKNYQFDRQLALLWQFYTADNKIIISDTLQNTDNFWLFFDNETDNKFNELGDTFLTKQLFNPNSQVILSGAKPIGFFDEFAKNLPTNWVYYLPFNFLKEGNNFNAFFNIELLLIGEKIKDSFDKSSILKILLKNSQKHNIATIKTIEFVRASIAGMLATRLSFINEMARLADSHKINIKQVQTIMGQDSRIGKEYLSAGWGFGGKSLPDELAFLMQSFEQNQVDTALLKAVVDVNTDQKELIFRKFWQYFNGDIDHKTVVIWGAGYRTGAGRTTGSAVHILLNLCWHYGIKTLVYTINTAYELTQKYENQPLFQLIDNPYALNNAHALFMVNWSDSQIDISALNEFALPIFDGKNVFSDTQICQYKGYYTGIGCFDLKTKS